MVYILTVSSAKEPEDDGAWHLLLYLGLSRMKLEVSSYKPFKDGVNLKGPVSNFFIFKLSLYCFRSMVQFHCSLFDFLSRSKSFDLFLVPRKMFRWYAFCDLGALEFYLVHGLPESKRSIVSSVGISYKVPNKMFF